MVRTILLALALTAAAPHITTSATARTATVTAGDTKEKKIQKADDGFIWYETYAGNGLRGATSKKGKRLIPEIYDFICYHTTSGGWFEVRRGGKCGAYTKDGIKMCDALYESIHYMKNEEGGYLSITKNGKTGALNERGQVIVEPSALYNESFFYSSVDGFNYKDTGGNYVPIGIDINGHPNGKGAVSVTLPDPNEGARHSSTASTRTTAQKKTESDGYVWYKTNGPGGTHGAIAEDGSIIVPTEYTYICYHTTDGGWFAVGNNGLEGAYTTTGHKLCDPLYEAVYYRKEEDGVYVKFKKDGKTGALDINGNVIVRPSALYNKSLFYIDGTGFKYKDAKGNYIALGITLRGTSSGSSASAADSKEASR